jgi:hypothetical protein
VSRSVRFEEISENVLGMPCIGGLSLTNDRIVFLRFETLLQATSPEATFVARTFISEMITHPPDGSVEVV